MIGGSYTSVTGQAHRRIARLHADGAVEIAFNGVPTVSVALPAPMAAQGDGRLVVGGAFSAVGGQAVNRLARLRPDGSVDASPAPTPNSQVTTIVVQPDLSMVVGGSADNDNFARLNQPRALLQSIEAIAYSNGPALIRWRRVGAAAEFGAPPDVAFSLAGSTYSVLGTMRRRGADWVYRDYIPPLAQTSYLRVRQFHLARVDGIFADGPE